MSITVRGRFSRLAIQAGTVMLAVGAISAGSGGVASAAVPVQPFVTCYWQNADGSVTADVGYTNSTSAAITYPVGPLNFVSPAPQDRGQPTVYQPGTHNGVWTPTISVADLNASVNWTLNGVNPTLPANLGLCPTTAVPIAGGAGGVIVYTLAILILGAAGFRKRIRYQGLRARFSIGRS